MDEPTGNPHTVQRPSDTSFGLGSLKRWLKSAYITQNLTAILISAHAAIIALIAVDRVTPAIPIPPDTHFSSVYAMVDDWYWMAINAACLLGLLVGMFVRKYTSQVAMWSASVSFTSWLVWGSLLMGWSVQTRPPVSLVGPTITLAVVLPLSLVAAWAWSEQDN